MLKEQMIREKDELRKDQKAEIENLKKEMEREHGKEL